MSTRPGLLVSVRSVAEAEAALCGGAAIIDVKEPAAGSLGKASDEVIAAIVRHINGRRPVSAALGELIEGHGLPDVALTYVKWGLADCRERDWRSLFTPVPSACITGVVVAYADWEVANAPPLDELCEFACGRKSILLIDTWRKHAIPGENRPPNLLDWLTVDAVKDVCQRCREAGSGVALAGSLNAARIDLLTPASPDWFAVRGAACEQGERGANISVERVRELAAHLDLCFGNHRRM